MYGHSELPAVWKSSRLSYFFWFYHNVCHKILHENVFVGCVNYDNINIALPQACSFYHTIMDFHVLYVCLVKCSSNTP